MDHHQRARDFVAEFGKAVNGKDVDAILALCRDDIVFVDAAFPEPFHGHDGMREAMRIVMTAFPDLQYHALGEPLVSADGDVVATHVRFTGTMTGPLDPPGFAPTGQPIDVSGVETYTFAGDRLTRIELCLDTLELGRQVGAAPPAGSAMDKAGVRLQHAQAWLSRRRS